MRKQKKRKEKAIFHFSSSKKSPEVQKYVEGL
jgi:hypothetical protein